jgi:glycosyltransferase involved in cell wall biosynthesis
VDIYTDNIVAPTVSVVIPLYNKGKYIERALSSVLAQTHPPLEIIVVDDGSTDNGPEKVLNFNNPKINLVKQENKGPGAARNAGLAIARGKYISFLDADDEWLPSFLEAGLALLEDKTANVTFTCTGFYYYPGMRRHVPAGDKELKDLFEITAETDKRLVQQILSFICTCAILIRTDIARKWGGFFDSYKCLYGEDVYLVLKLLFNERIGIIPEPHVIYHTEASDLYGGSTKNIIFPTAPYLEDPSDVLASCPPATRHILKELLSIRALRKAESLAKWGLGKEAMELLNRFNQNGYPSQKEVSKVRFFASIAPLLPTIRWFWRNTKSMIGVSRTQ